MSCTATLTTATVEPCELGGSYAGRVVWLAEDGNIVSVVTLHTLTCQMSTPDKYGHEHEVEADRVSIAWQDGTPGASPHAEPLVTEAEVRAIKNWWATNAPVGPLKHNDFVSIAEAAALARKEGCD